MLVKVLHFNFWSVKIFASLIYFLCANRAKFGTLQCVKVSLRACQSIVIQEDGKIFLLHVYEICDAKIVRNTELAFN